MKNLIKCPNCKKVGPEDSQYKWKPFCSERCKLIDLGSWIEGNYRIVAEDELIQYQEAKIPTKH